MEEMPQPKKIYKEEFKGDIDIEEVLDGVYIRVLTILNEIRKSVEAKEYGMVLGIDASGRVPALLIAEVLKKVAPIDIRFIAGVRHSNQIRSDAYRKKVEETKEFVRTEAFRRVKEEKKKVLIVDDTIATGESLQILIDSLMWEGIKHDIVALSGNTYNRKAVEKGFTTKLVLGSGGIAPIYGKTQMSGVEKDEKSLHASSLVSKKETDKISTSTIPDARKYSSYKGTDNDSIEGKSFMDQKEVLSYTRKRIHEMADDIAGRFGW